MRFLEKPSFDFLGRRKIAYIISTTLILLGFASMLFKGLNYGIDFKGGTEMEIRFDKDINIGELRTALLAAGVGGSVKNYGSQQEVIIRTDFDGDLSTLQNLVTNVLTDKLPDNHHEIRRIDAVGPSIADDLKWSALQALFGALIAILLYVGARFEFKFATAGVVAIFHDVLIVLGLFSIFGGVFGVMPLEVDQSTIAAFLTIAGYSITDTVVVYDRIRENLKLRKNEPYEKIFNDSLNETLSRTVITSGTTLLTVLVLFILAGPAIRSFAFAILMGILIGTYSSLFVAAPIVLDWQLRSKTKLKLRG
ncbi:protein-export membrane protein SecF [Chloroherpeton thalassium ATCC 35110]|uniref:Protein-export membrane protein SecF n=1 Tax=Chloroherpeton thalassium (strain ATCC 35110 / GB-78) TaxID=517418 RepID=B3QTH6_CHLT3|nr:protein translocase subunit SecF [Chloroherpeton thalassium]ACF12722.1 protein-export membrane protein SecF [Chloroherpeton thalassium ATCC 35110]